MLMLLYHLELNEDNLWLLLRDMSIFRRAEISLLLVFVLVPLSWSFVLRRLSEGPSVEDDAVKHLHTQRKQLCEEIPPRVLRQVLGSAYNDYYMAFDVPESLASDHNKRSDNPRNKAITNRPFFVRHDLERVLSDEPAWKVDFAEVASPQLQPDGAHRRKKRDETQGSEVSSPEHPATANTEKPAWETDFPEDSSSGLQPAIVHPTEKPAWETDFPEDSSPGLQPAGVHHTEKPAWETDFPEDSSPGLQSGGVHHTEKPAWETDFPEESSPGLQPAVVHHTEKPAWETDFPEDSSPGLHSRGKRNVPDFILDAIGMTGNTQFRWHCEAPLKWIDLGRDYFPRYLLSVDCNHSGCQGSRFKCEPRSFAVKVLRKRQGLCAPWYRPHKDTLQMGSDQMPESLKELWVWEMRAISFCCVCQYQ